MTVDMHEGRFRGRLEDLPEFIPAGEIDRDIRKVNFPAWRAIFTSLLLYGHSTGYRLPSFEDFSRRCELAYAHKDHNRRFDNWFSEENRPRTEQRLRFWYEGGMAEEYLYCCLVDALEDKLRNGVVLYDPRVDWKLKYDMIVLTNGHTFGVNAFWGEAQDRRAIEEQRDASERVQKAKTSTSSHWGNVELTRWVELTISRTDTDHQAINGIRVFSITSVNKLLRDIYERAGVQQVFYFPEDRQARDRLYRELRQ